jgi:tRNA-dihydrouridine synthase
MNNILAGLSKPFFALAPMDDVTDSVFRQIIASCVKPDLFITEFVNVDGLQSPGKPKLIHKLQFTKAEKPIFAQVWGKLPDNYLKTAEELVAMGFDGVDINMGCPDKKVVRNGCCSALINNRALAAEIITATKSGTAGKIPVSVKMRTGLEQVDLSWPQFILEQKVDLLTVHGRTTKEMTKVPSNWEDIAKVRKLRDQIAPKTLIIGNGDVISRAQGEALAVKYRLDGIMIGRGIFNNPYVFAKQNNWDHLNRAQKLKLYKKHIKLFIQTWDKQPKNFQMLKKFAKIYINGFANASELRSELVRKQTVEEMLEVLNKAI